ncbi:helicase-associated domain-containing protein [Leucobacter ruminantium]|uniref:Helicase-associated domain-containing protein n=1 Tax=Leucobacter ruminantium TaxID=1289170 RepID=A0A939LVZ5_9MICO|nr:helicase-associated domain-containing protein [Leucobacter ruminantium]MBO1805814.1 helicase-associated domain-containing protein [Leucobacter ruminantium]
MSGTLALAAALAAMDRGTLAAVVERRRPQAISGITDPIGLASELLRADSVERAIAPLERDDLAALLQPETAAEEVRDRLLGLGLLGWDEGSAAPLPEVAAALTASLDRVGLSPDSLRNDHVSEPPGTTDTASWYVAALTALGTAAEVLRALRTQPGRLNRTGTVAVATVKSLAEATRIDVDRTGDAVQALLDARLLVPAAQLTLLSWSPATADWLELGAPDRWVALGAAAVAAMPPQLRRLLEERDLEGSLAALRDRYPLLPASTEAAARRFGRIAEHLGLAVDGALGEAGRALLADDLDAARAIAERDMPAPVAGVYIQPDLSVVVPGPLAPSDEAALAALTVPEQTGIASTRRITEASIAAALERGFDAAGARSAFERLSLTGIPQPLDYMLASIAERIRGIVVREHSGDEGRTRLDISRPELRETLLVDRALHHLQLAQGEEPSALYSRLRADHVFAALGDARYTASFEGAADSPLVNPAPEPRTTELPDELAQLVDRVHSAVRSEPGAGGFARRLELAIRDRSTVRVTASAQGRTHVFTLLPTSLDAGRLRATDPGAGVERTLPISTITAVE